MTRLTPNSTPHHLPAPRRVLKVPPKMVLAGALAVLSLAAAACGGGGSTATTAVVGSEAAPATTSPAQAPSTGNFEDTRPGTGIAAADGDPGAVRGVDPCANPDSAAGDPFTVAYVGPDLSELGALGLDLGLGLTVVEDPTVIIDAYFNEVNVSGGINGRCVELDAHLWSLNDPVISYIEVCSDLSQHDPIFYFSFQLYDSGLTCATFGTSLPTIGLYTSRPEAMFAEGRHLLYADDGSVEHLLSRSVEVGLASGAIGTSSRVGLLHGSGPSSGLSIAIAEELLHRAGLDVAATADIPRQEDASLELLRSIDHGMSDAEHEERHGESAQIHDELHAEVAGYFAGAAARFKNAGVTAVVTTSHWSDVRRMMLAAESIDWTPTWLTSDMQPATLTTGGAPERQVENLRQVSARRAAGDVVPPLDQGCVTVRNTSSDADPFTHRPHTDAWNLIMSICDYLDVAFSALSRVNGEITHLSFLNALNETHYETDYGGLITFSSADRNGADRFRILQSDSGCVLNYWGCMRATTDWLSPEHLHEHEQEAPELGHHDHEGEGEEEEGAHEEEEEEEGAHEDEAEGDEHDHEDG